MQIAQLQAHAAGSFQAKQGLRIGQVQQGHVGVVFIVAGVKHAHHLHLFQARQHPCRGDLTARRDHRHLLAHPHPQAARQLAAQNHPKAARLQLLAHGGAELQAQIGDCAVQSGVDAPHHRTFHVLATGDQGLGRHKRRASQHIGVLQGLRQRGRRIGQGAAIGGIHLDVRHHPQHAVAHLFLKAVHHAQYDDERGHPQRDAQH